MEIKSLRKFNKRKLDSYVLTLPLFLKLKTDIMKIYFPLVIGIAIDTWMLKKRRYTRLYQDMKQDIFLISGDVSNILRFMVSDSFVARFSYFIKVVLITCWVLV